MTNMYIMTQEVMSHAWSANLKLQKCTLNNQTTTSTWDHTTKLP